MKTCLILSAIFAYLLCSSSTIYIQEEKCVSIKGNEIIVPFHPPAADTCPCVMCSKESISKIEKVVCTDTNNKVVSFTAVFQVGDVVPVHCKSNVISLAARKYMDQLQTGGRMWIEQIGIKTPDGTIITIPGFCIKIK
jgi:hypothetical protein